MTPDEIKALAVEKAHEVYPLVEVGPHRAAFCMGAEFARELLMASEPEPEREIAFDDVRLGDEIETRRIDLGCTSTHRGIVGRATEGVLYTSDGAVLAVSENSTGWTIHLLHRPAPTERTGRGAVVRARLRTVGAGRVLTRVSSDDRAPWLDEWGIAHVWDEFDPDSIEVLSEGIEVAS